MVKSQCVSGAIMLRTKINTLSALEYFADTKQ